MKPAGKNDTTKTMTAPKKTGSAKVRKADEIAVFFEKLNVSKWNRSFDLQSDPAYVDELAMDIKRNGLIHPLTLVKSDADGEAYEILAGANRYWALLKQRGDNSGLRDGEYIVRTDVKADDPRCLDISLSENGHRRQSSVIETARYVYRLLKQEHVDQSKLARKLHLRREVVNRYSKLVRCFEQLPDSWKKDLSRVPADNDERPLITASHWVEVAGVVGDQDLTPEVKAIMEGAAKKGQSTRELRDALGHAKHPEGGGVVPGNDPGKIEGMKGEADEEQSPTPSSDEPAALLDQALKAIHRAESAIKADRPDKAKALAQAAKKIEEVLKSLTAEQTGTRDAA